MTSSNLTNESRYFGLQMSRMSRPVVVFLAFISWVFAPVSAAQTPRIIKELHGISPGKSTVEALKGTVWRKPVSQTIAVDGTLRFEYHLEPWDKVIALARDNDIVGIDLFPPFGFTVNAIASGLQLGKLTETKTLPNEARFAADDIDGKLFVAQNAFVLLEVVEEEKQPLVKRIRFFGDKPIASEPRPAKPDSTTQATTSTRSTVSVFGVIPGRTTHAELPAMPNWGEPQRRIDSDEAFNVFEHYNITPTDDERKQQLDIERMAALDKKHALTADERQKLTVAKAARGLNGAMLLVYSIKPWTRVTVHVQDGIVWVIDAIPPRGTTVQQLERELALGDALPHGKHLDVEPAVTYELAGNIFGVPNPPKVASAYDLPQCMRVGPMLIPSELQYQEYSKRRIAIFCRSDQGPNDLLGLDALAIRNQFASADVRVVRFFANVPQRYPVLGIHLIEVSDPGQIPSELNRQTILKVTAVIADSPGEKVGFQADDLILTLNGQEITELRKLQQRVIGGGPDTVNEIVLWRNERKMTIRLAPAIQSIASAYLRRGSYLVNARRLDTAIDDLTMVLKLEPNNAWALSRRGECYHFKKMYQLAIADQTQAIELNPVLPRAHFQQGLNYYALRQFDRAIDCYTTTLNLDRENPQVLTNRGIAWSMSGDSHKGIADLNRAIELAPKYVYAYTNRGLVWEDLQEPDRALADYTESIRLAPRYIPAYQQRASLYRKLGQPEKATADENTVKTLQSRQPLSEAPSAK